MMNRASAGRTHAESHTFGGQIGRSVFSYSDAPGFTIGGGVNPERKARRTRSFHQRLQRIHEAIQRHIDASDISGAVTLVSRKGRIAHFEAHGLMDIDSKKPMSKDAIFRIASMSKPITGVAIMMLMEEGKIRLTDPVSKFIPEFKGYEGRGSRRLEPAAGRAPAPSPSSIQFRRTAKSRYGICCRMFPVWSAAAISASEAAKIVRKPTDTLADYIPRLGATPLDFQPGSRWSYSPRAGSTRWGVSWRSSPDRPSINSCGSAFSTRWG